MDVCCKNPNDDNNVIKPIAKERKGCGIRNPEGVGFRITGDKDNEAQFGEFPWMVLSFFIFIPNWILAKILLIIILSNIILI